MVNDMEMYLEKVLKKTNPEKYIEILEQDREDFAKEIVELNQRIDNAIEFIEQQNKFIEGCDIYLITDWNYVLDLLKGEDKE